MSEEKTEAGGEEAAPPKPKKKLDPQFLLVLLNTISVLALGGVVYYTKFIYKKPVISEEEELQKQMALIKKPQETVVDKQLVTFDQQTITIAPTNGKGHFITISLSVECVNPQVAANVTELKPIFNDKLLKILSAKQMSELNTIQGKLLLKTDLMKEFNDVIQNYTKESPLASVTDIYFAYFILQ